MALLPAVRIFRGHTRLVRPNVMGFRRRMRAMQACYAQGGMHQGKLKQRVQAWLAHAAHGNTWKLRGNLLELNSSPSRKDGVPI